MFLVFFWKEAILTTFETDDKHVDSQKSVLGFFRSFEQYILSDLYQRLLKKL